MSTPRAVLVAVSLFLAIAVGSARADNSLYGTYDLEGRATLKVASNDLPFGLGSISLDETTGASGTIKLQSDKLIVQLDEPISRKEVIKLNRKLRAPNRDRYRYRTSGSTSFRGNDLDYRVALRLKRVGGKWEGRGRVVTRLTSGNLAGSSARVRGKLEQR